MAYSGARAQGDTDLRKNLKSKISCQTPLKVVFELGYTPYYKSNLACNNVFNVTRCFDAE